jgi:hypothetical protein
MYQDKTGLVFLNFTSAFGFIGNWFFAIKEVKNLIGEPSKVFGWFKRGMGSLVMLKKLETSKRTVKSYPVLWEIIFCVILVVISVIGYAWLELQLF